MSNVKRAPLRLRISAIGIVSAILALTTACESLTEPDLGTGIGAARPVVGGAVYAPITNLGQPIAAGQAKQIFANLEKDDCVVQDSDYTGDSTGQIHTWTSTTDYFGFVKSDTNLSGSLANEAVMSASLEAVADRTITRTTKIAGSSYEYHAYKKLFALADDCVTGRNNKGALASDLIDAFNTTLAYPVSAPDKVSSWENYDLFLRKFGTHYVNTLKTGVRYQRYTFLRTYKETSESSLAVAACVAAEGVTPAGEASVQGCQGIDKKERSAVDLSDYTDSPSAYGGNEAIRNKLSGGAKVTPELLAEFADTADVNQDGVQYSLAPIWELLYARAKTAEDRNKALTVQAYFEGFVASNCNQIHGCGCTSVMDRKNNVLLRKFVQTSVSPRAEFQCQRPAMGCRNTNDCHWNITKFYCQCYGDHCVNTGDDKISAVVNYSSKIDGKNTGPNRSCYHDPSLKSSCSCRRPDKDKFWSPLWSSQ